MNADFKSNLRQICLKKRKILSSLEQHNASHKICKQISELAAYQHAQHIGLYAAVNREIDLTELWHKAQETGKNCYFPAITSKQTLLFLPTTITTPWRHNQFKILEPDISIIHARPPNQLDLLIAPLVAFDTAGTRLGMGAGYYDRTLAHTRPALFLGVAYAFQQQPYLNAENWDIPLDGIITPEQIFWRAL